MIMPKTLTGKIFFSLDKNWNNCKLFFIRHKTFFEIGFIGVYSIEQILLLLSLFYWKNYFSTIIAFYTTILITTIGIERIFMNYRYSYYKNMSFEQTQLAIRLEKEIKEINKRNKDFETMYLKNRKY